MMLAAGIGSAMLLAAAQPLPPPAETTLAETTLAETALIAAAPPQFAPPVDRPMTYRVKTRRAGRDGNLIDFTLIYALRWQRVGRGYRLAAVLQRIESGASPAVTRALTMMLQPLVGQEIVYLVAPDGSRIDPIDADGVWQQVEARIAAAGAQGNRADAQRLSQLIAALPVAERDRLATADIRAVVAPANAALVGIAAGDGARVSVTHDGLLRTIARVERGSVAAGARPQALDVDHRWTVDTATGLVVREQRQSWVVAAGGERETLIEERERTLESAP